MISIAIFRRAHFRYQMPLRDNVHILRLLRLACTICRHNLQRYRMSLSLYLRVTIVRRSSACSLNRLTRFLSAELESTKILTLLGIAQPRQIVGRCSPGVKKKHVQVASTRVLLFCHSFWEMGKLGNRRREKTVFVLFCFCFFFVFFLFCFPTLR